MFCLLTDKYILWDTLKEGREGLRESRELYENSETLVMGLGVRGLTILGPNGCSCT